MKRWFILLMVILVTVSDKGMAQNQTKQIAIFTPFYLDSAYQHNQYTFGNQFPKFLNPGLEFWQGAQIAIDSLQAKGFDVAFHVFDIKSKEKKLLDILIDTVLNDIDLIIGQVNVNEASLLAQFAKLKEIPFVNINLPNSVNQKENPYYFILNATLPTHFKAIYRFIQSNYSVDNVILFKRKNEQDNMVSNLILEEGKKTAGIPLKIKVVELPETFNIEDLDPYITEEKNNIVIASSLDAGFARKIVHGLNDIREEQRKSVTVIGMPTWDQLNFTEQQYKGIEILYTTPFNFDPTSETIAHLTDWYKSKYFARPSDMVFRGYEMVYKFSTLLTTHEGNLALHPNLNGSNVFTRFHILPIYNADRSKIDYWENQKIYFVKLVNGEITEIK